MSVELDLSLCHIGVGGLLQPDGSERSAHDGCSVADPRRADEDLERPLSRRKSVAALRMLDL